MTSNTRMNNYVASIDLSNETISNLFFAQIKAQSVPRARIGRLNLRFN